MDYNIVDKETIQLEVEALKGSLKVDESGINQIEVQTSAES